MSSLRNNLSPGVGLRMTTDPAHPILPESSKWVDFSSKEGRYLLY